VYTLGQLENGSVATHAYDSSGTYTIEQKAVYNSCGFTRVKKRTVVYNKPPKSLQYQIAIDTFCDRVELTLTDSLKYTADVVINWGDGSVDSIFSTKNSVLLNAKHTYTTQDTFTITYQLMGFAADTLAKNACMLQYDTSLTMAFIPHLLTFGIGIMRLVIT
jgi:hypothetical protein